MPLFRIMGGSRSNSSSTGSRNSAGSATATPNPTDSRSQRHTYPGQRAAVSNTQRNTPISSLPTEPPRTSQQMASSAPLVGHAPQATSSAPSSVPMATAPTPNNGKKEANRPGAYQVTRETTGAAQVYRVNVPSGVQPGSEFTVHAGSRRVRVRCPPTSSPGHSLQITLPPEPITLHASLKPAPLTAPEGKKGGGYVGMNPEVRKVNDRAEEAGGTAQTFLVTIPPNIYPGMQFTVNVNGQRFMVTCPQSAGPNMRVRIVPPTMAQEPEAAPRTQIFEVNVPPGVQPGQPFALVANGQRVLVTCPPNVEAGRKIRFQLPVSQVVGRIELNYESEKGGWRRTIRVQDLKFQWVRLENTQNESSSKIDISDGFDFKKAAYVRKITYLEGNDARMRTGRVDLGPAADAVVDSKLVVNGRQLMSYADIADYQGKTLHQKTEWFQKICEQLTGAWEDGHIKIIVRRKHLLLDSVDAIMSLGRDDLRKRWRIEFLGEPGIDAGGVTREWFELVTEQIYDPDFGLWLSSVNNQMSMNINPRSGKYHLVSSTTPSLVISSLT